eukprot:scaffold122633_cov20-Tisochrysis_lutea.AAC.2
MLRPCYLSSPTSFLSLHFPACISRAKSSTASMPCQCYALSHPHRFPNSGFQLERPTQPFPIRL